MMLGILFSQLHVRCLVGMSVPQNLNIIGGWLYTS